MNSCRCQANCCGLGDGMGSAARAFAGLRQTVLMSRARAANRCTATGGLFTNSELNGAKGDRATAGMSKIHDLPEVLVKIDKCRQSYRVGS